jgi:cellulose synthase/poly-beta-1,6-N-acetylglucosamine synthase-like glycosyltransferase
MESETQIRKIEIEEDTLKNLNVIRKWAMFFSILGYIFLGLVIIIGIIAGTFLSAFKTGGTNPGVPESVIIIMFFVLAAVYFFPVHFLFRFSKHTARAVHTLDKNELYKAFRSLKSYCVYLGVLLILGLALYVVTLIVAGTSMAFLKGL